MPIASEADRWWVKVLASVAAIVALTPALAAQGDTSVTTATLRKRALEQGYNLDHANAIASFRHAIAIDPDDADAHRLAAAAIWMQILFDQGAITVEDYLGQAKAKVERPAPPRELADAFRQHLARAWALAEEAVRRRPHDANAHFQLGAAAGLRASYISTVEGRVLDSVGAAKRAYREHRWSLALDPARKDAGLIVGLYQYGVASLSFPVRLMARFAGFDADRDSGIRFVESAAAYPSATRASAQFSLVLLYNREGRHDDALRILRQLRDEHPRNRLVWLEMGSTLLRNGRAAEAVDTLTTGLERFALDSRPRAYGEEARWRYQRGDAYVTLREIGAATRDLHRALAASAPAWVHGRVHLELGKIADLSGDRAGARARYRLATSSCRAGHDTACAEAASRLLSRPFR